MFVCGKSQEQVRKLIAGPGVYICDECVDLCNEILDEELLDSNTSTPTATSQKLLKSAGIALVVFRSIKFQSREIKSI